MKPVNLAARLATAETELACVRMVLAHVKLDRDELRQERDEWRRGAEMLCAEKLIAAKLREADERRLTTLATANRLRPVRVLRHQTSAISHSGPTMNIQSSSSPGYVATTASRLLLPVNWLPFAAIRSSVEPQAAQNAISCWPTGTTRRFLRWGGRWARTIRPSSAVSSGRWPMVRWRRSAIVRGPAGRRR